MPLDREFASLAKRVSIADVLEEKASSSPTEVISRRSWFCANTFIIRSVFPISTPNTSLLTSSVRSRTYPGVFTLAILLLVVCKSLLLAFTPLVARENKSTALIY